MKRSFIACAVCMCCGCQSPEGDTEAASGDPAEPPIGAEQGELSQGPAACPVAGELDASFGGAGTGLVRLSIRPDDGGGVFSLDLNGDGIVAAGQGFGGLGGVSFKVARLRGNGAVDPTFGGGQVVGTRWGRGSNDASYARAVGRQSDGRAVVIGWFEDRQHQDVALARYNDDGTLDSPGFGGDGMPLVDLGGDERIEGGLVTPDDRLLAVGARDGQLLVARFTAEGALDRSFAGGVGYFTATFGDSSTAAAVALDDRGNIVVAGSAMVRGQSDLLLLRLSGAGSLDSSFGAGGHVLSGATTVDERAVALALSNTGEIVVAGEAGSSSRDFLVGRFRTDGTPDAGFGDGGLASCATTPRDDRAEGVALGPHGTVLVVGNSHGGGLASSPVVARYTAAGALDPAFGDGGVRPLSLGDFGVVHTIRMDALGMALIGGGDEGGSPGPGTYLVVARMCP